MKTKLKRFILAAAKITFLDDNENVGVTEVNAVDRLEAGRGTITVDDLKKIQEAAQLVFFSRVEDPNFKPLDVTIISLNALGEMTEEKFGGPNAETELTRLLTGGAKPN